MSLLVTLLLRICWIVVIPMVFHRVNMSWDIAQENLKVLASQANFVTTANTCGDNLYSMNLPVANSYMEGASQDIQQAWRFSCAMVIFLCCEIVLIPACGCVISCCLPTSQSSKETVNDIVYEKPSTPYAPLDSDE